MIEAHKDLLFFRFRRALAQHTCAAQLTSNVWVFCQVVYLQVDFEEKVSMHSKLYR